MIEFTETHSFKTVEELFDSIAPWRNTNILNGFIFRGHSNEAFELIPSALRLENSDNFWRQSSMSKPINNQCNWETMQIEGEFALLRDFYRSADQKGLEVPISNRLRRNLAQDWDPVSFFNNHEKENWLPIDLLEVAALAQHYGIPTRLLDWTYDIFVALYFAFRGAIGTKENMAIWCLNKEYLSFLKPTVSRINIDFITPHYSGNPNLKAQKGLFTHWPIEIPTILEKVESMKNGDIRLTDRSPLDSLIERSVHILDNQPIFRKFIVPCSEAEKGCKILDKLGYDSGKLFPGYNGIARQILEKHLYY